MRHFVNKQLFANIVILSQFFRKLFVR